MATIQFSQTQLDVFEWVRSGSGSAVVEAVAGAGKTTTLVEAVRRMSGKVFLGAYNKKMADELKKRVAGMRDVVAGTFHSAGFSALRYFAEGRVEVDDKNKKMPRIAAGVCGEEYQGWEAATCALVSLAKQAGFLCRQSGLVASPQWADWLGLVERYDVADHLPDDADPRQLVKLAIQALILSNKELPGIVNFDDMVYGPLYLNLRMFRNDWVLVDEAQDTNAVRRALAEKMLRPGGRLVAVGDPHQAIYGFSGADSDSLDLIRTQFSAATMRLSVSWRCPRAVVKLAQSYVTHIEAAPTAEEGEASAMTYEEMRQFVVPGDAVVCRFNRHLVDLCFSLIRAGKPAKIEGRAIGEGLAALAGRWRVRTLEALESRLEAYLGRELRKAADAGDEAKADRISDQVATLQSLISGARERGVTTVDGLRELIRTTFDDVGSSSSLVVLSSVHRAKGLEWPRVFVLGLSELMPSPRAVQPWQRQQELNLCYVAVTRAQSTVVDVSLPVAGEKRIAAQVAEVAR